MRGVDCQGGDVAADASVISSSDTKPQRSQGARNTAGRSDGMTQINIGPASMKIRHRYTSGLDLTVDPRP
jgi:hypothetical protein